MLFLLKKYNTKEIEVPASKPLGRSQQHAYFKIEQSDHKIYCKRKTNKNNAFACSQRNPKDFKQ